MFSGLSFGIKDDDILIDINIVINYVTRHLAGIITFMTMTPSLLLVYWDLKPWDILLNKYNPSQALLT